MSASEIIVFDVETTGMDRRRDQVIELCVQHGLANGSPSRTWRIRPEVSIGPGAEAVHGITMADLANAPVFAEVAEDIRRVFDSAEVVVGYNIEFDIGMLQAEYQRLGQPPIDFAAKRIVDAFRLWQQCEPRSLQHAHQRFVGDSFAEAHSAAADVAATGRVLEGMLDSFGLAEHGWEAIAEVCEPERATWIGPSRHIRWDDDGNPVLGFGKHAGKALHVLAQSEGGGYLKWILSRDFPPHVHDICAKACELPADELIRWVRRTFTMDAGLPGGGRVAGGLGSAARSL